MSGTLCVSDFAENRALFSTSPPVITVPARRHPVTILDFDLVFGGEARIDMDPTHSHYSIYRCQAAHEKAFIGGRNGFLVVEVSRPVS